jgi:hypothetical protein
MARRLIGCGRAAQGNEFSYQMLLASNYVLNAVTEPESCAIRPFIDCPNNHTTRASMLAPVRIHRAVRALAPVCRVFGSRNRIGDSTRRLEISAPLSHILAFFIQAPENGADVSKRSDQCTRADQRRAPRQVLIPDRTAAEFFRQPVAGVPAERRQPNFSMRAGELPGLVLYQ